MAKQVNASASITTFFISLQISLVFSIVERFTPAPGPIRKDVITEDFK